MSGVKRIAGRAVVVMRSDVDTDQIIPAAWLKKVERTGFGTGLFEAWRRDPAFALNQPGADQAKVLVSGPNFGCGSSREHAVWALQDFGFQAVVAPSFADISLNNCISSGLVPAQVSGESAARLFAALAANPHAEMVVDVAARTVAVLGADLVAPFALNDFAQWRLLEGLDDVALTLRHEASIEAFEASRPAWLPVVAAAGHIAGAGNEPGSAG
jgi:3-isopropylmalate/(R)-2-methylmalate dehydratase small subunit